MASGSSSITGGGLISVSECRFTFSDLLHLLTASTPRTPRDTTRTRVNRNVRANVRATVAPVEKDVTVQNKSRNKSIIMDIEN